MSSNETANQMPQMMSWDQWTAQLDPKSRQRQRALNPQTQPVDPPQYYLLYLPSQSGDDPELESAATVAELTGRVREIRENAGDDDQLFLFYGKRLHITRGAVPHLVLPGLQPIPLVDVEQPLELADDGFISEPPPELPSPNEASSPEEAYEYMDYYDDELVDIADEEPVD